MPDGRYGHTRRGNPIGLPKLLKPSTELERAELTAKESIEGCAAVFGMDVADVVSGSRKKHIVEARRLIATLGRDRRAQSTKSLASALNESADTVTYMQREGIKQRLDDEAFAKKYDDLDNTLIRAAQ